MCNKNGYIENNLGNVLGLFFCKYTHKVLQTDVGAPFGRPFIKQRRVYISLTFAYKFGII